MRGSCSITAVIARPRSGRGDPDKPLINDILSAHLAVADLTFHNPNVFYELGIRHAVQKPVIHFAQTGTPIPFDNIGYRAIIEDVLDWNGQENGRVQLRKAVQAIEGVDYRRGNPVTHARGTFELKKSADPQDQILANIVDRVRLLEENNKILIDLFDNVGPGRTSPRERLILESRSLRRWIEMEAESMSDDEKVRMLARIRSVEHLIDLMG